MSTNLKLNKSIFEGGLNNNTCIFFNAFWVLFGVVLFTPIEIFTAGLYLAYFQIVLLVLLSDGYSRNKVMLVIFYIFVTLLSMLLSSEINIYSLINPIFMALFFAVNLKDAKKFHLIKIGFYISAVLNAILLLYLIFRNDIGSLYFVLTNREWAVNDVHYFGNGLAMMFSAAMLLAFRDRQFIFFVVFFVGGLLTTSRIPFLLFLILVVFWVYRLSLVKSFFVALLVLIFIISSLYVHQLEFFHFSLGELEQLNTRLQFTGDRKEVYELALQKFFENPIFGVGGEKLDFFEHAHNSYLQVLYKGGVVSFVIWISLLYHSFIRGLDPIRNFDFFCFFALVSFFQLGLHSPNLIIALLLCYYFSNVIILKKS